MKVFEVADIDLKVYVENIPVIESYCQQFIHGDSVEVMRSFPDNSIDLVVTSPPYNLKNSTGNGMKSKKNSRWPNAALCDGYDGYDDNMPYDMYCQWQRECLQEMYRVIKDTGAIFYNHKWRVQGGLIQDRREIVSDFPVRQIIIWKRSGGMNFNKGYFVPTYEVIYLIAKKQFELVPMANKYGDVWEFRQEMKNPHPAPFPVALIDRIISSTYAEVILDPFMGSGTVAISAVKHGRKFIGIDRSKAYIELAQKRLKNFMHSGAENNFADT